MNARSMMLFTGVLVCALLVAGCGSDSDGEQNSGTQAGETAAESAGDAGGDGNEGSNEDENSGEPLDKEEFIKQANAACAGQRGDAFEKMNAYVERHQGEGLSEEELSRRALKAVLLSTIEGEIEALRELSPPEGDEQEIERILASMEEVVAKVRKTNLTKGGRGVEDFFVGSDKMLKTYGLDGCTKN